MDKEPMTREEFEASKAAHLAKRATPAYKTSDNNADLGTNVEVSRYPRPSTPTGIHLNGRLEPTGRKLFGK